MWIFYKKPAQPKYRIQLICDGRYTCQYRNGKEWITFPFQYSSLERAEAAMVEIQKRLNFVPVTMKEYY